MTKNYDNFVDIIMVDIIMVEDFNQRIFMLTCVL